VNGDELTRRLTSWFEEQLSAAEAVGVERLDRFDLGHSAEMRFLSRPGARRHPALRAAGDPREALAGDLPTR